MKKARVLAISAIVAFLTVLMSGCGIDGPFNNLPPFNGNGGGGSGGGSSSGLTQIQLVSQPGKIYRPLFGNGDDWVVQPLNKQKLLFATGRDQYNNPVGLKDDTVWRITEVTIRCAEKNVDDTIFNPGDPYKQHGFSCDSIENACMWYPTYTGTIEGMSGLPYSLTPEVGYPFDACRILGCDTFPEQLATISAKARADYITIRIIAPRKDDGQYVLDLPGAVPQTSNEFVLNVGHWGEIDVVWSNDDQTVLYKVDVPAELFWISGSWTVTIMSTGTM